MNDQTAANSNSADDVVMPLSADSPAASRPLPNRDAAGISSAEQSADTAATSQPPPAPDVAAKPSFADPPFCCPPDPYVGGVVIDLPMPPSVNRIWRHNKAEPKKVSLSKEYSNWKKSADALAMSTGQFRGLKTIVGKFSVGIILQRTRGDLDNRIKGVLDYLQSRAVIADDKYCERITVGWGNAPAGCRVTIVPHSPQTMGDILLRVEQRLGAR